MIRATHGFHHGVYYYECEINFCDNVAAFARVGWSTRFGELQAPVGYDSNSFGFCSGDGLISFSALTHFRRLASSQATQGSKLQSVF
jgi:hypothetical protein